MAHILSVALIAGAADRARRGACREEAMSRAMLVLVIGAWLLAGPVADAIAQESAAAEERLREEDREPRGVFGRWWDRVRGRPSQEPPGKSGERLDAAERAERERLRDETRESRPDERAGEKAGKRSEKVEKRADKQRERAEKRADRDDD